MTTTISSTGSISSAGLGSGLDVDGIVTALVNVEKQPITDLQTKETALQSTLSTYGSVKSYLSSFRDAADTLSHPAIWAQTKGSSSDAATVAISSSSDAIAGSYAVEVQSLATPQSNVSSVYAATTVPVGAGMLRVELGTWSAAHAGFTTKAGAAAVDITIGATDTLADVRDKINGAGAGVNASILNDASGARLVIRSTDTGAANGFRITATDDDGNNTDAAGLSALAYDPTGGANAMTLSNDAGNANATINGIAVTSATNSLTNVMDGVSLTLNAKTTAPVQLTVAKDTDAMKTAVTSFVTSYNQLMQYLSDQTKYNADTKVAGALQGDSTANGIRNQIRSLMGSTLNLTGSFSRLSDVGFDVQKDGTIKVDDAKLGNALANTTDIKALFASNDDADPNNSGIATQLRTITDAMLGTDGMLSARTQGIQSRIDDNEKQQSRIEDRVSKYEKRVRAQYTALDTTMSQMSSLSTYLTQQLASLNSSSSKN